MTKYEARISKNRDNRFYAMIVRIDYDGEESVVNHYNSRHFATEKAAIKSTSKYLREQC